MKKRSLIYVILCLAMLSGCIQHTEVDNVLLNVSRLPSSGSRISFEKIDLEIDKITAMDEESIMVYSAMPVKVTKDEITAIAEYAGINEYGLIDNQQTLSLKDMSGNAIIVFKASGSIQCSFSKEKELGEIEQTVKYSDDVYIEMAERWLSSTGLLSEDYQTKKPIIKDNGFITKTLDNGQEYAYPTVKTVEFMYKDLNGIEVNGVAPRIVVDVSLDGDIVSVTKIQRQYQTFRAFPSLKLDKAIENLVNGIGTIYTSGDVDNRGTVKTARLVYYNMEVMDASPYLIPVYVFEGHSGRGDFIAVTYAIDEQYFSFVNQTNTSSGNETDQK